MQASSSGFPRQPQPCFCLLGPPSSQSPAPLTRACATPPLTAATRGDGEEGKGKHAHRPTSAIAAQTRRRPVSPPHRCGFPPTPPGRPRGLMHTAPVFFLAVSGCGDAAKATQPKQRARTRCLPQAPQKASRHLASPTPPAFRRRRSRPLATSRLPWTRRSRAGRWVWTSRNLRAPHPRRTWPTACDGATRPSSLCNLAELPPPKQANPAECDVPHMPHHGERGELPPA